MKETDPFERIEWTPPILGWHYRINWNEEVHGLQRIYVGLSDKDIEGICIYARLEPKIRSHWGITMSNLSISRSASELRRAIEMVEQDTVQIEEWLEWLREGR